MNLNRALAAIAVASACTAPAAWAAPVSWTDWTTASAGIVGGSLTVGSSTVGVTYTGPYAFAQTSGGTNYWLGNAPYLSSVVSNAPGDSGNSDIIGLSNAGRHTISFSSTVHNPLIALVSFNGANITFDAGSNLNYLSSGCGFWGCGGFGSPTSTSFTGSGELHGVVQLQGDFDAISFTNTFPENWHGITVGVEGLAVTAVPEPETYAMMLAGLGLLGFAARRRKKAAVAA
jgi:PEP-CTERM motif